MSSTMKLRVAKRIPLPHRIVIKGIEYAFTPDAEIPSEWAKNALQDSPHIYSVAKGEPDMSEYTFREAFKVELLHGKISQLNDFGKAKVLKLVDELIRNEHIKKETEEKKELDAKLEEAKAQKQRDLEARQAKEADEQLRRQQEKERLEKAEEMLKNAAAPGGVTDPQRGE